MTDKLIKMITAQRELQERLGFDMTGMPEAIRLTYVTNMYVAAIHELGEAIDETPWKLWAHPPRPWNTDAFIAELSDAFQFIMNMWFAAMPEATSEQIAERMHDILFAKIAVNHRRAEDGYDGRSNKCTHCKRALDDPAVRCWRLDDQAYCAASDVDINLIGRSGYVTTRSSTPRTETSAS